VDPVRIGEAGNIGAIVDDDARLMAPRELDHGGRRRQQGIAAE